MVNRHKQIVRVSIIGVLANLLLAGLKMLVGVIAGSIAIILDAVNNLTDVMSSVVTIVGAKIATKRPDPGHPFGHGRSEYISALLVGLIICAAGVMALFESVPKIIHPELADYSWATIAVVVMAIIVKLALGTYVRKMGKKLESSSLAASGIDALFDAVLSFATLVGIAVTMIWQISIDGILGVLIGLFILRTSLVIILEASDDIIGRNANRDLTRKIRQQISSFPGVSGVYDLTLHDYGHADLIGAVKIQVPDEMTAQELHKLTQEIAHRIDTKYDVNLTIGVYADSDDPAKQEIKQKLLELLNDYPEVRQMHALYIDDDEKLITFDVVVDYQYHEAARLKRRIAAAARKRFASYKIRLTVDYDLENTEA